MKDSNGSNRTFLLLSTVAVATASSTILMYRWFWYKTTDEAKNRDNRPSQALSQQEKYDAIRIKVPLRNVTPRDGEQSRIVYLTGIDKETTEEELVKLFSCGSGGPPVEIDASEVSFRKGGGRAWAMYGKPDDAKCAIEALHGKSVRGCILCARIEWGVEKDGRRITDKTSHTAILRGIQRRRGTPRKKQGRDNGNALSGKKPKKNKSNSKRQQRLSEGENRPNFLATPCELIATYSHNSISIGEMEYPFPSGIYLTKLIQRLSIATDVVPSLENNQQHQREQDKKLLRLLADVNILGCGSVHRYAKEISEVFAMVDALERGIKLTYGVGAGDLQFPVICYCLGDGKYPIGAAALELFLQKNSPKRSSDKNSWKFIAIDPLLPKPDVSSNDSSIRMLDTDASANVTSLFHDRIELFSGFSQDFSIENTTNTTDEGDASDDANKSIVPPLLSIAIACHSHAPLEEFWERMPNPKLCVALPCCAQFSELPKETPILEYDNFEVYSPKRKIKIFSSK